MANNNVEQAMNNLDYLNNKMDVLSEANNSSANSVKTNDRDNRKIQVNKLGYIGQNLSNLSNANYLLGDIPEYKPKNANSLSGPFRNNIMAVSNSTLDGQRVPAMNNTKKVRKVAVPSNNVSGYNNNNLITKNPFPGNNVNYVVESQPAELNVSGYDALNNDYLRVNKESLTIENNNNNNVKENLTIEEEFRIGRNIEENFLGHVKNNVSKEISELNNLVQLNGVENKKNNSVLNNTEQKLVHSEEQELKINEIGQSNNNEVKLPQSLLFTSPEQLKDAQNRNVYCNGLKNNEPIRTSENSHSAQGYDLPGEINGYNQSGARAINYLCVSDNC